MSNIVFSDETHSYLKNNKKYKSVSTFIGEFKQEYDSLYWSLYKSYEQLLGKQKFKDLRREYSVVLNDYNSLNTLVKEVDINKLVKTQLIILKSWDDKRDKSIVKGNNYHSFKEQEAIKNGNVINILDNLKYDTVQSTKVYVENGMEKREPVYKSLKDLPDGFHPELILWNDTYGLAGQSDMVFIRTENNIRYVQVNDFKTNTKIDKSNFFQKMKSPISHLDDCKYNQYRLQISMYAWFLENEGYVIENTAFTHLNEIYKFDYMKHEIESLLNTIEIDTF